jgi:hypothetical protein
VHTGRSATEGKLEEVWGGGRIRLCETVRLQFYFIFPGTSCNIILDIRQDNTVNKFLSTSFLHSYYFVVFPSRGPWMHRPSGWINKCILCMLPMYIRSTVRANALTLRYRYGQIQAFQKRGYGKGRFDFDFDFNFTASRSKRPMLLVASNRGSFLMVSASSSKALLI